MKKGALLQSFGLFAGGLLAHFVVVWHYQFRDFWSTLPVWLQVMEIIVFFTASLCIGLIIGRWGAMEIIEKRRRDKSYWQ